MPLPPSLKDGMDNRLSGVFLQVRLGLGEGTERILLDSCAVLSNEPDMFSKEEVISDNFLNDDACFMRFI